MSFLIASAQESSRLIMAQRIYDFWVTEQGKDASTLIGQNTNSKPPASGYWLQVAYQYGAATPAMFSDGVGAQNEKVGLLILTVYGPKGEGVKVVNNLAGGLRAKFEGLGIGGVRFAASDGPFDIGDAAWATAQVRMPFRYFEVLAA